MPLVPSRGAVEAAESRPLEPPGAAAPDADVGDETVTLTRSVIYVSSPSSTSSRTRDNCGNDANDGASVSSFDVDINNDSRRGHKQQSPGDASRTTRSRSAPGNGPGDDEAVARASHDVEPPCSRDIVENNAVGRTNTQTTGPHSTEATRSLDNDNPLANAIRAITSGETPAGLAFIGTSRYLSNDF